MEKPHKGLRAWQIAIEIVHDIYRNKEELPTTERFKIVNQLRRAAVSIPSNQVEWPLADPAKNLPNSCKLPKLCFRSWIPILSFA